MQRRTFLQALAVTALAGCGNGGQTETVPVATASPASTPLTRTHRVVFGPEGDVYELIPTRGTVSRSSPTGQLLWTATGLGYPHAAALDPQGRLWVVERDKARLVLLGPSGRVAGTAAEGQLSSPRDVAVSANLAYVSDFLRRRVVMFALTGQLAGELKLRNPRGLALDPAGRLHVADGGEILVFSRAGTPTGRYGGGRFVHPYSVAIRASDGLIAACDAGRATVEQFSPALVPLDRVRTDVQPVSLAFEPSGRLVVSGRPRA